MLDVTVTFKEDHEQLCWYCKFATNAYGGPCPYAYYSEPVPGWDAQEMWRTRYQNGCGRSPEREYRVYNCPMFERDIPEGQLSYELNSQRIEVPLKKRPVGNTNKTKYRGGNAFQYIRTVEFNIDCGTLCQAFRCRHETYTALEAMPWDKVEERHKRLFCYFFGVSMDHLEEIAKGLEEGTIEERTNEDD